LYFYPNSSTEKPVTIFPSLCENFLGFRKNSFLSQFDLLLSYSIFNVLAAGCRTHTRGGRLPLPYSRAVVSAFSVFAPASGVSAFRLRSGSIAD